MFGFRKTLDIITLFHKANSPASTRIVNLLKQASTNASQAANETPSVGAPDSSPTSSAAPVTREPFDLNITEDPPTADQVETILEYVPKADIGQVVSGAETVTEAMRRFKHDAGSFQRPMVVDWNNGKVVIGDQESKILKMLQSIKE